VFTIGVPVLEALVVLGALAVAAVRDDDPSDTSPE